MPKIHFPAYFENGLLGMKCKEDIFHNEAFLFIPYKIILNVHKAQKHEILGPIIKDNHQVFSSKSVNWEQLTLVLYLMYEKSLGEKSYWHLYLKMLPKVDLPLYWSTEEISAFQDPEIEQRI